MNPSYHASRPANKVTQFHIHSPSDAATVTGVGAFVFAFFAFVPAPHRGEGGDCGKKMLAAFHHPPGRDYQPRGGIPWGCEGKAPRPPFPPADVASPRRVK